MNVWRAFAFAVPASLLLLGVACSSDNDSDTVDAGDGSRSPDLALDDVHSTSVASPESLSLDLDGDLVLGPGEVVDLAIEASPPAIYELRLSLLDEVHDASLAKGRVDTNERGRATVTLTAPTTPATFRVRVTSGDVSMEAAVHVEAEPVASLTVRPVYAGQRETPVWIAEAFPGLSCSELGATETETDLSASADDGEDMLLKGLPVGVPIAVSVRYEHAVSGCANLSPLKAEEGALVEVQASDLPTQVETTEFSVRFSVDVDFNAWRDGLALSIEPTVVSALGSGDNARQFLDTMAESLDLDEASSFATARAQHSWDAALRNVWGSSSLTRVADTLQSWMEHGVDGSSGTDVFVGTLDFVTNPEAPLMPLTSLAGIVATQAALATPVEVDLQLESSNWVVLGARFYWQPSRLLAGLALRYALETNSDAETAADALAAQVDCGSIARALVLASGGDSAYDGCDEACAAHACLSACDLIWISVRGASAQRSSEATLDWSARARAEVDEGSQLTSFDGDWVGTLAVENTTLSLRGSVAGSL